MPLRSSPKFSPVQDKRFEIANPGIGGINLKELEFNQKETQSPYMLNMMYRNGSFSKRYGQEYYKQMDNTVYAIGKYKDQLVIHSGSSIFKGDDTLATNIPESKGVFFNFDKLLYYLVSNKYYQYDGTTWKEVEPYIPDVLINRKPNPDDDAGDTIEDFNRLGTGFKQTFDGDGKSTSYQLYTGKNNDFLPYDDKDVSIVVTTTSGDETYTKGTDYTWDYTTGKVTFIKVPPSGTNNVCITAYKTQQEYIDTILNNKYAIAFGGNNNSYLFLAGGGNGNLYYSGVRDASYFPENNYISIGNTQDDIQGFGEQYDVLVVFKPTEMYSLNYYTYTDDDGNTEGQFKTLLINPSVGCDCPNSIQLVNNLLVWCSTEYGVCTLVSTAIEDERNVRVISYNIEGGNRQSGILQEENLKNCVSVDFDSKYFLTVNGNTYMWDYQIAPYWSSYLSSTNGQNNAEAKRLAWFLFDNMYVDQYIKFDNELYYSKGSDIVKLNQNFRDFDEPINAYYMTPYLTFGSIDYLKTIKNIYLQVRGDTAPVLNIYYLTEESSKAGEEGQKETETITLGGALWAKFDWSTFEWTMASIANVYRRRCMLKKIQMCAFYITNNQIDRDMNISDLVLDYTYPKKIK